MRYEITVAACAITCDTAHQAVRIQPVRVRWHVQRWWDTKDRTDKETGPRMTDDTTASKEKPPLWDRSLTITTALLGIIGTAFTGGGWIGLHYGESKALAQNSELVAKHAQVVADLKISDTNLGIEKKRAAEMQTAYTNIQSALADKERQVLDLSRQLGLQSNCTFVQQQIRATQAEIDGSTINSIMAFSSDVEKGKAERNAKLIMLEQRLAEYQKQLGTCNR